MVLVSLKLLVSLVLLVKLLCSWLLLLLVLFFGVDAGVTDDSAVAAAGDGTLVCF